MDLFLRNTNQSLGRLIIQEGGFGEHHSMRPPAQLRLGSVHYSGPWTDDFMTSCRNNNVAGFYCAMDTRTLPQLDGFLDGLPNQSFAAHHEGGCTWMVIKRDTVTFNEIFSRFARKTNAYPSPNTCAMVFGFRGSHNPFVIHTQTQSSNLLLRSEVSSTTVISHSHAAHTIPAAPSNTPTLAKQTFRLADGTTFEMHIPVETAVKQSDQLFGMFMNSLKAQQTSGAQGIELGQRSATSTYSRQQPAQQSSHPYVNTQERSDANSQRNPHSELNRNSRTTPDPTPTRNHSNHIASSYGGRYGEPNSNPYPSGRDDHRTNSSNPNSKSYCGGSGDGRSCGGGGRKGYDRGNSTFKSNFRGCSNCGQEGHSKADCGHRTIDCPDPSEGGGGRRQNASSWDGNWGKDASWRGSAHPPDGGRGRDASHVDKGNACGWTAAKSSSTTAVAVKATEVSAKSGWAAAKATDALPTTLPASEQQSTQPPGCKWGRPSPTRVESSEEPHTVVLMSDCTSTVPVLSSGGSKWGRRQESGEMGMSQNNVNAQPHTSASVEGRPSQITSVIAGTTSPSCGESKWGRRHEACSTLLSPNPSSNPSIDPKERVQSESVSNPPGNVIRVKPMDIGDPVENHSSADGNSSNFETAKSTLNFKSSAEDGHKSNSGSEVEGASMQHQVAIPRTNPPTDPRLRIHQRHDEDLSAGITRDQEEMGQPTSANTSSTTRGTNPPADPRLRIHREHEEDDSDFHF